MYSLKTESLDGFIKLVVGKLCSVNYSKRVITGEEGKEFGIYLSDLVEVLLAKECHKNVLKEDNNINIVSSFIIKELKREGGITFQLPLDNDLTIEFNDNLCILDSVEGLPYWIKEYLNSI